MTKNNGTTTNNNMQPIATMPSADLVAFRFDQSDKNQASMGLKLDTILAQISGFPTEARARKLIEEAVAPFRAKLNNYTKFLWTLLGVVLLTASGVIVNLVGKK